MSDDILPGLTRENAKKALALAVERGFREEDVRTTREGFLIPGADESTDPKPTKTARKRSTPKE